MYIEQMKYTDFRAEVYKIIDEYQETQDRILLEDTIDELLIKLREEIND